MISQAIPRGSWRLSPTEAPGAGSIQQFFTAINRPTEAEWLKAVEAVRAGHVDLPDMRREPAESSRFVQVIEERAADSRPNFAVTGSEITSAIAA